MNEKLFLAPRSNEKSRANFLMTLETGYPYQEIEPLLSADEKKVLGERKKLYIWGNQVAKKSSWNKMSVGDFVAFYAKGSLVYVGRCVLKKHSSEIARRLWGNAPQKESTWEYTFFLDTIRPIEIQFEELKKLGGYKEKMVVQGFMPLNEKGMKNIVKSFGSLNAFFDAYSAGLNTRQVQMLDELGKEEQVSTENLSELDSITRGRDLDALLLEWEQRQQDSAPIEIERKSKAIKRNAAVVRKMKELFGNKCQICGFTFVQKNGDFYSEVAHIEPVSKKVVGIDVPSNMIVLCPNHHKMLDLGKLRITSDTEYLLNDEPHKLEKPLFRAKKLELLAASVAIEDV